MGRKKKSGESLLEKKSKKQSKVKQNSSTKTNKTSKGATRATKKQEPKTPAGRVSNINNTPATPAPVNSNLGISISLKLEYKEVNGLSSIIAKEPILSTTQFGPIDVECFKHKSVEGKGSLKMKTPGRLECHRSRGKVISSNWMSLVKYSDSQNNLVANQRGNDIYFTAIKDIREEDELIVAWEDEDARDFVHDGDSGPGEMEADEARCSPLSPLTPPPRVSTTTAFVGSSQFGVGLGLSEFEQQLQRLRDLFNVAQKAVLAEIASEAAAVRSAAAVAAAVISGQLSAKVSGGVSEINIHLQHHETSAWLSAPEDDHPGEISSEDDNDGDTNEAIAKLIATLDAEISETETDSTSKPNKQQETPECQESPEGSPLITTHDDTDEPEEAFTAGTSVEKDVNASPTDASIVQTTPPALAPLAAAPSSLQPQEQELQQLSWTCKFCTKIAKECRSISKFAFHLIKHYIRLGAARTETARLHRKFNGEKNGNKLSECEALLQARPEIPEGETSDDDDDDDDGTDKLDFAPRYPYICDICTNQKVFNRGEYMIRHLKKHAQQFSCMECSQIFRKGTEMIQHDCVPSLESKATICAHIAPPICQLCKSLFESYEKLQEHVSGAHVVELFDCPACHVKYGSFLELEKHLCVARNPLMKSLAEGGVDVPVSAVSVDVPLLQSESEPDAEEPPQFLLLYKCELCPHDLTTDRKEEVEQHLANFHGSPLVCQTCAKILTPTTFKNHVSICAILVQFAKNPSMGLPCPICISTSRTELEFRSHVAKHTNPYKCSKCCLRLHSRSELEEHRCRPFCCESPWCAAAAAQGRIGAQFETVDQLKIHMIINHVAGFGENFSTYSYCYECCLPYVPALPVISHDRCRVGMYTFSEPTSQFVPGAGIEFDAQVHRPARTKRSKNPNSSSTEKRVYQCEKCGAQYFNYNSFKTHRKTHADKKFSCDACGKSFHRKDLLGTHMHVHDEEPQFGCEDCGKLFKTRKSLIVHLKIHAGLKRFECEHCNLTFSQKTNLISHSQIHLPKEERGFRCQHCSRNFSSKEYLAVHLVGHELGKRYGCPICGRGFLKRHMAEIHRRTVHTTGLHHCEFCSGILKKAVSFVRHLRSEHGELKEAWSKPGYVPSRFFLGESERTRIKTRVTCLPVMTEEPDNPVPAPAPEGAETEAEPEFLETAETTPAGADEPVEPSQYEPEPAYYEAALEPYPDLDEDEFDYNEEEEEQLEELILPEEIVNGYMLLDEDEDLITFQLAD